MARPKRQSLGKGLDALFVDNHVEDNSVTQLRISEIEPNKGQPRVSFDETSLRELADSIAEHGVLQPLVVRPLEDSGYQIVAGERRWRASRMAGLSEIPVIIKELSDGETLEIAIIENLQREDLSPVELAQGYQALMEQHGFTQQQVSKRVGKSRSAVANTLRLLNLPEEVLTMVQKGVLSQGHARALLAIGNEAYLIETARRIEKDNLSVREIEKLARKPQKHGENKAPNETGEQETLPEGWGEDSFYKEIELALCAELGRKVTITQEKNKGTLSLEYYNKEDLSAIAERLTKK